jgi:nitrogen regulatory protein P-II 1
MQAAPDEAADRERGSAERVFLRKVTAIVRTNMLEAVERRLHELKVPGISVTKVKGYGEYANFFTPDWTCEHARIEIFLSRSQAGEVARAIAEAAQTGEPGDGIVVVLPVESMHHIRSGDASVSAEFTLFERDQATSSGSMVEVHHG